MRKALPFTGRRAGGLFSFAEMLSNVSVSHFLPLGPGVRKLKAIEKRT